MLPDWNEAVGLGVPSNLPIDGHSFRRVEVLTGSPRRRRWSTAEKMAIVAESLTPGAVTSEIALRYGLHRNQLYGWRREFRAAVVANAGVLGSDFVPIVADNRVGSNALTIEIGGAIVRVEPGVDPAFLSEVIRLLKAVA
jgi:transposase